MKILCIAASFIPSNTANSMQVVKVTQALSSLGHDVTLLVPGRQETSWDALQTHYGLHNPISIHWIPENLIFRRYDFTLKALHYARQHEADLVYTWVLQAAVLSLGRGLPVVLELHDRVTGKLGPWLFRRFYSARNKKRLLTNTEALRRVLISDFSLQPSSIDIVAAPNGVDLERYQDLPSPEKARQELGLPEGFTAGYSGHFYHGRGIDLMMELARQMPGVQFLLVGGEPSDVTLWKKRLQLQNIENVTLTGFIDNARLPLYQAASEVLLMPYSTSIAGSGGGNSADVASPMKMFEYLAAGRAILSSDLPVVHEVLDESTAVFCPPDDPEAWKEALNDLQADPSKREKLGSAARTASKAYTWHKRAERALSDFP
ncbi:MAG: glycosyltransferase family 4 protein [Chloroflexota bacterium]|nr:glycosyltransferase family 4 protein [Chloroflexota bacterium]